MRTPTTLEDIANDVFCSVSHNVQLKLRWIDERASVELIYVPGAYRERGLADAALARICALADLAGWPLILEPSDGFGSDRGRLVRWYFRHGFAPMDGRWMLRSPR